MKLRQFITLLISMTALVNASAQTGKGSFMIGGSMNFVRSQDHDNVSLLITPTTTFSLSPTLGYFFVNNLMTGLQTSLSVGWKPGDSDIKSKGYAIGPLLRYYFPFGKFAVFPEVAGVYNFQSINYVFSGTPVTTSKVDSRYTSYRAGAGIAWFVSPNIGIEGIIAYRQNNFITTGGWQSQVYLNIGIQFYLPGKN